jgi:hypothetical protein
MLNRPINATLSKVHLSFSEGILSMRFAEKAVIEVEDVIYIYCYGLEKSGQKPYGILFDSTSEHELSEEAVVYLGDFQMAHHIIAIAYISKTLISKIRLSLLLIFERPPIKLKSFSHEAEALQWLEKQVSLNI